MADNMPCKNMLLCLASRFSEKVLRAVKENNVNKLEGLKADILADMLNPHIIPVANICNSLQNIDKLYYNSLLEGLSRLGYCVIDIIVKTKSKLLIGASSGLLKAVFEVGLAWDHNIDLPYIPASSVKGLLRSWLLHTVLSNEKLSLEKKQKCVENILMLTGLSTSIFGREEEQWVLSKIGVSTEALKVERGGEGLLFIADAYPVGKGKGRTGCGVLDFDVITPHYYQGGKPVNDEFESQPVPVQHLLIAEGVPFRFIVALDFVDYRFLSDIAKCIGIGTDVNHCSLLSYMVLSALWEGVGARTSKGYGLFDLQRVDIRQELYPTLQRHRPGKIKWKETNKR